MQKKVRILVDILMTVFFIILMGYHLTENNTHEILGTITFILFIVHHILNRKWYKTIFKGKYNFRRAFMLITNILLFISMLGMMISGIMLSTYVFSFLNIPTTMFARKLHMVSTSWGFVLMTIHLGLHLQLVLSKWSKKLKSSSFEYVYYLLLFISFIFGCYSLIKIKIWEDMLLFHDFKFYDYNQSSIMFYLQLVFIILAVAVGIYFIFSIIKKRKAINNN